MAVEYFAPLTRAFGRMKGALFNPFDLRKWFVVGFGAWLAGMTDMGPNGGFPGNGKNNTKPEDIFRFPEKAWEWLQVHPGWALAIVILIVVGVVLGILIAYISARAKFVFIDSVVRDHALIAAPWKEYRREGHSLFLWILAFYVLSAVIVLPYLAYCFLRLKSAYEVSGSIHALILPLIAYGLGLVALALVFGFAFRMLNDFVAPLMYRDRLGFGAALEKFMGIFLSRFLYFLGYVVFLFLLLLGIGLAVLLLSCATCCIGFLVLMIPYVGAVALLPVSYTLRAFSLEFLGQFGFDYRVFPTQGDALPDAHDGMA